jgi:hypothetical protein
LTTLDATAPRRDANDVGSRLARPYAPLAAAGLLAALAGPLLNRTLAGAAQPAPQLAGFWLGYSVLLLLEAACFVWQPTSLAFLQAPRARRRLVTFALVTGGLSAALVWLAGRGAIAAFVFRVLVPTSPQAAEAAGQVLRALAPLPVFVAVRGVLAASALRDGRGAAIPAGLLARLAVIALWPARPSASGACEALLAASAVELLVLALARTTSPRGAHAAAPLPTATVARVAAPLVVSTLAWAALRPLLHAILGRLAHADLAQARFGLLFALFMTLCAPVWALQDLSVYAIGGGAPDGAVRAFARRVAVFASLALGAALLAAAGWPPVRGAFGFTAATGPFAWVAAVSLGLAPFLVAARAPAQGALIAAHRTAAFAVVPATRLALTAPLGLLLAHTWPATDGAMLGAGLLLGGEAFEAWAYRRIATVVATQAVALPADAAPEALPDPLARVA